MSRSKEVLSGVVAEVRRLRDENAALERKLNAALVDVVNMANEETAAAEAHEEALDRLRDENAQLDAMLKSVRAALRSFVGTCDDCGRPFATDDPAGACLCAHDTDQECPTLVVELVHHADPEEIRR